MTLTRALVGAAIGIALLVAFFFLIPNRNAYYLICLVIFYEAWTLVNRRRGDTISDALWFFGQFPFIPYLFGIVTGWALSKGHLNNPYLGFGVGFLAGHFFWQKILNEKNKPGQ